MSLIMVHVQDFEFETPFFLWSLSVPRHQIKFPQIHLHLVLWNDKLWEMIVNYISHESVNVNVRASGWGDTRLRWVDRLTTNQNETQFHNCLLPLFWKVYLDIKIWKNVSHKIHSAFILIFGKHHYISVKG